MCGVDVSDTCIYICGCYVGSEECMRPQCVWLTLTVDDGGDGVYSQGDKSAYVYCVTCLLLREILSRVLFCTSVGN